MDLVSDGQSLYWLNYGDGYVNRMPSAGGAVTRLAKSEPGLSMGLAADSDNVYWVVDGLGLLKVAQSGGDPQVLAWGDSLGDLLWVQGETVYFYSDIVRTVPRTGGQSAPLRLEPSCPTEWGEYVCSYLELYRRASAVGVPVRLSPSTTVDSESVYSTMGGTIERLHSNGVYWQTLAIDKAEIRSMVVADDYIYWASSDGRIKRIDKAP